VISLDVTRNRNPGFISEMSFSPLMNNTMLYNIFATAKNLYSGNNNSTALMITAKYLRQLSIVVFIRAW